MMINSEKILRKSEYDMLVERCWNEGNAKLMRLLWESGCRISEMLGLRKRDVEFAGRCAVLHVEGKTGPRAVPVMRCAGMVMGMIRELGDDDRLFPASYNAYRNRLLKMQRRFGLRRFGYHAFRHAATTNYLRGGMPEPLLKKMMGWTPDSKMLRVYSHICAEDVMKYLMEMNGHNRHHQANYNAVLYAG